MSITDIDPQWLELGRTDNASFYAAHEGVIVVVPDCDCVDDEDTARQSIRFQRDFWRAQDSPGVAVVLMDRIANQTKGARRVYQDRGGMERIAGFALVSSSAFGRAVASVFMGLTRPPVPTRMFSDLPAALTWARARCVEARGR